MIEFFRKQKNLIDFANFIFLCFFAVYTILREVIPVKLYIGSGLLSAVIFAGCFGFMFLNFLSNRKYLKVPNVFLFAAFIVVMGITTLINKDYCFSDNVKAILWMLVFFFYLYPTGYHLMSRRPKYITILFSVIVVTLTALMLVSLLMYIYDVDYDFYKTTGAFTNQGFSNKYIRLWGVFQEANYGGIYSAAGILLSLYLFLKTKKVFPRILLALASSMFMCFIVLSGSRTTQLVTIVISAWMAFYISFSKAKKYNAKQVALSVISCLLSVLIYVGVFAAVKNVLPYVKLAIRKNTTFEEYEKIHLSYDNWYKNGDVNVLRGYYTDDINPYGKKSDSTDEATSNENTTTQEDKVTVTKNQNTEEPKSRSKKSDTAIKPTSKARNITTKTSYDESVLDIPKLKSISCTEKGVVFSWHPVNGAERYVVYRRIYNSKAKAWDEWEAINRHVKATSIVDETVEFGKYYIYTVKAACKTGYSAFDESGLRVQFLPPQMPGDPNEIVELERTDLDKQDFSNGRLERWGDAIDIFKSAPIFGASPRGIFEFAQVHNPETTMAKYKYSISNVYLEILVETGIIGALVILLIIAKTALTIIFNTFKKRYDSKFLVLSSLVLLLAGAAGLQSDLFFNLTFGGFTFWLLLGLINNIDTFYDSVKGVKK